MSYAGIFHSERAAKRFVETHRRYGRGVVLKSERNGYGVMVYYAYFVERAK